MKFLIFLVNLFVIFGSVSSESSPGKVVIWKVNPINQDTETSQHLTRTIESSDLINSIDNQIADQKNVVILKSEISNIFTMSHLISSIEKSAAIYMPNVYHAPGDIGRTLHDKILSTAQLAHTTEVKLSKLPSLLQSSDSEKTKRSFSVVVSNSDHQSENSVFDEIQRRGLNVMFIAVEEPVKVTTAPVTRGDYARLLSHSVTSTDFTMQATNTTNIVTTSGLNLYKPAGAEYSIYYGGTYLYITPDIFTGLMTSIFIFFVLLVGFSCLGGIQTPSTFSSKIPPVGREA